MPILSTGAYTQTAYSDTPATQEGALRPASSWPVLSPAHGYPHSKASSPAHGYSHCKAYTSAHGYPHSEAYTSAHCHPHAKAYTPAHRYPHSEAYTPAHGDSRTLQPLWGRQCGRSKPAGLSADAYARSALGPDTDTHAYPRTHEHIPAAHTCTHSYCHGHAGVEAAEYWIPEGQGRTIPARRLRRR